MTSLEQIECMGTRSTSVRTGVSDHPRTDVAIHQLLDELEADAAALTFVFFSPEHDARTISTVLDERVGPRGIGGTSGGELSAHGMTEGTITGMSFHGPGVRATADVIPNLDELSLVPLVHLPDQFARRLGRDRDELDPDRHAWLLFADGQSGAEDLVTPFFMQGAPATKLVGGSLGSMEPFESGRSVYHGRVYDNAAVLVLLEYDGPFELFHHCHLELTDTHFEVTAVSDNGRILDRLDGRRAVDVYAEAIDVAPENLGREVLARHPLGFPFRGRPHACAPVTTLERGRLRIANTVHPGDALHLLEPNNLVESTRTELREALDRFEKTHGVAPQAALMFQCLGRYIEACDRGVEDELADAIMQLPLAGFNARGEQINSLHTNLSLTGLLFG